MSTDNTKSGPGATILALITKDHNEDLNYISDSANELTSMKGYEDGVADNIESATTLAHFFIASLKIMLGEKSMAPEDMESFEKAGFYIVVMGLDTAYYEGVNYKNKDVNSVDNKENTRVSEILNRASLLFTLYCKNIFHIFETQLNNPKVEYNKLLDMMVDKTMMEFYQSFKRGLSSKK